MAVEKIFTHASEISDRLQIREHGSMFWNDRPRYWIEHTVHELAHALTLGLDVETPRSTHRRGSISSRNTGLSREITNKLSAQFNGAVQIANERRTWSVEWLVLQQLGPDFTITWQDVSYAAEQQGVDKWGMERMEFDCRTWWARKYAAQIVAMLT